MAMTDKTYLNSDYLYKLLRLVFKEELYIVRREPALKIPPRPLNSLSKHHLQVLEELLLLPVLTSSFPRYLLVGSTQADKEKYVSYNPWHQPTAIGAGVFGEASLPYLTQEISNMCGTKKNLP